jgi:hypothetical protein
MAAENAGDHVIHMSPGAGNDPAGDDPNVTPVTCDDHESAGHDVRDIGDDLAIPDFLSAVSPGMPDTEWSATDSGGDRPHRLTPEEMRRMAAGPSDSTGET